MSQSIVRFQLIFFPMVNYDRKQERRRKSSSTLLLHVITKNQMPSKNRLTTILNWKKPKSCPGFEPGLLVQNAVTLLYLPPLPRSWRSLVRGNSDVQSHLRFYDGGPMSYQQGCYWRLDSQEVTKEGNFLNPWIKKFSSRVRFCQTFRKT